MSLNYESMWLLFQKRCAKHDRLRVKDWQIEVDIVKMRDLAKHQIDVTWVSWRISSTATPLFVQQQLHYLNTLRPRQKDRHCEDHIFKRIFLIEIYCICIRNSLKYIYVSRGPIIIMPGLVQMMPWRRTGDKPLSEAILAWFTDPYMRHSASMD